MDGEDLRVVNQDGAGREGVVEGGGEEVRSRGSIGMVVFFGMGRNKSAYMEFPNAFSVLDIKKAIARKKRQMNDPTWPPERISLIYNGAALDNNMILTSITPARDTGIFAIQTIHTPVSNDTYQRPPYRPPRAIVIPDIPLPAVAIADKQEIFVWCTKQTHTPLHDHDHAFPHQVQRGVVRYMCAQCKQSFLDFGDDGPPVLRTWTDLYEPPVLNVFCYLCNARCVVEYIFQCNGTLLIPTEGRTICKANSSDKHTVCLPCLDEGRGVSIDTYEPNPYQFVYTCGHRFSARSLATYLTQSRRWSVRNTHKQLLYGEYVVGCSMIDNDGNPCPGVLPLPSCRVAGEGWNGMTVG